MKVHSRIVDIVGSMPPYYEVAYAIWGNDADFDTDGDSDTPESTSWRELTVTLRPDYKERLDIDPFEDNMQKLNIKATSQDVLERACAFLQSVGAIKIEC